MISSSFVDPERFFLAPQWWACLNFFFEIYYTTFPYDFRFENAIAVSVLIPLTFFFVYYILPLSFEIHSFIGLVK